MSDRISNALKQLADAVIDEANEVVIKPILSGAVKRSLTDTLFGKDGIFTNISEAAKETTERKPTYNPKDTTDAKEMARVFIGSEKVDLIIQLKAAGKTDQQIADFLNVDINAVKLF